jgi:propanol-preferring alcohol dehydrogenase
MEAFQITQISKLPENRKPLKEVTIEKPVPSVGEVLIKVHACGICHTELDEIEGRTLPPEFPVIPGHQVIGTVQENHGSGKEIRVGDRVGVAWINHACGKCEYCLSGRENLCEAFKATGRDVNGGYAEFMIAPEDFVYKIPDFFDDASAAPLLCAGAVGYRSLRLTGLKNGQHIGFAGFGASAHLLLPVVRYKYPDSRIFVFARNTKEQEFARQLGAHWAGDTTDNPPEKLHCMVDTTPVWKPVVEALKHLRPGGRLVINAIRKEDHDKEYLQKLSYHEHLWLEREIKTVANVTRKDVQDFLELAAKAGLEPTVQTFPFEKANEALLEIKERKIRGAKVLLMGD